MTTTTRHLVLLVEEESMEAFLSVLLPRLLPSDRTFEIHPFRGKEDLLKNLADRLRAYRQWIPSDWRIVVLIDQDRSDCKELKESLEDRAAWSGLLTRTRAEEGGSWRVANRVVVQELEAWYFGDWEAVRRVYPRANASVPRRARYRDPDAIPDTWEAFERILRSAGYFKTGLRKIEAARAMAPHIDLEQNRSRSFQQFRRVIVEALS